MMFWIIFGALWGALSIIGLFLLASVPSSNAASNADLAKLVGICAAISLVTCVAGQGVLSLLGVL